MSRLYIWISVINFSSQWLEKDLNVYFYPLTSKILLHLQARDNNCLLEDAVL